MEKLVGPQQAFCGELAQGIRIRLIQPSLLRLRLILKQFLRLLHICRAAEGVEEGFRAEVMENEQHAPPCKGRFSAEEPAQVHWLGLAGEADD